MPMTNETTIEKPGIVLETEERYVRACLHYRDHVADAELTLAFLNGYQWVQFESWQAGIRAIENPARLIRETDNRMLPAYRRWKFYHEKEKPVLTAFEGGAELVDAESAAVAEKLFDYWESNTGWKRARQQAVEWAAVSKMGGYIEVRYASRPGATRKRRRRTVVQQATRETNGLLTYIQTVEEEEAAADVTFVAL